MSGGFFARLLGRNGNGRANGNGSEIHPDEVFLDASNLPSLDPGQLEGRVEQPVSKIAVLAVGAFFACASIAFAARSFDLQILNGAQYAAASQNNRLAHSLVFAERGVIFDRTGMELAWNEAGEDPFALRRYTSLTGLAHLVGYVRYPKTDTAGIWWRTELAGVSGVESSYDEALAGENGRKIVEVDALGAIQREHIVETATEGENLTLAVDAELQSKLHEVLAAHARNNGFVGGASVIMDIRTGEMLALTSFPEYEPHNLVEGNADAIAGYANDERNPYLNRAVAGSYTPGSIVKPIFAAAALAEDIISPEKSIYSPGYITIPNPYDSSNPTIMKDWKAHGWTDMREAIAVSSDVYFYSIGGGYEDQEGLGITKLDEYASLFGLGQPTGIQFDSEVSGLIPTPAWKEATFGADEPWRLGDTYNTSIGQYGFQITPVQAVRYTAAIANGGTLLTPHVLMHEAPEVQRLNLSDTELGIVRDGMRQGVISSEGTARSINISGIELAGKTGTAEIGSQKQYMNSWVIGFWPASNPQYAFATVLERAPAGTPSGAAPAMRRFFEWLVAERPVYTE